MKEIKSTKSMTIEATTGHEFDEKFNTALSQIATRSKYRIVDYPNNPLLVRIYYDEIEYIPESISEEYELIGCKGTCDDCPYFVPQLNKDGSRKKTSKHGFCACHNEPTLSWGLACDDYYYSLEEGRLKIG